MASTVLPMDPAPNTGLRRCRRQVKSYSLVPANAVAHTMATNHMFEVKIFTLQAKNSCTEPDITPYDVMSI